MEPLDEVAAAIPRLPAGVALSHGAAAGVGVTNLAVMLDWTPVDLPVSQGNVAATPLRVAAMKEVPSSYPIELSRPCITGWVLRGGLLPPCLLR